MASFASGVALGTGGKGVLEGIGVTSGVGEADCVKVAVGGRGVSVGGIGVAVGI
jgi:hypothetical protein